MRWSVAAAAAAFLALDLGRSLIAHFGYRAPAEMWQPDAARYADITWPPSSAVPAGAPRGQRVYLENCAICHGPDGRGNGAAAPSLSPRPRDLVHGAFKYKSTPEGEPPTIADVREVVAHGLAASAMPGFSDVLGSAEIDAVVAYVDGLRDDRSEIEPTPIVVPPRPTPTPASVAAGARLYREQGCASCHGDDLRGGDVTTDATGHPVTSRDLTAPWTFRGGARPADVYLRLTTGLAPSAMPAYASLPPQARWDLVAFLESRARAAPGMPGAVLAGPGQAADPVARGRYLTRAGMCGLCHTEVSRGGIYRDERYLAGGIRIGAHPQGVFVSRNLTPDPATGLGHWSEDEIARAIRSGRTADGRLLNVWSMPWIFLHNISQPDALAIARYLKTLPPVKNPVPRPLHYGAVETLLGRFVDGDVLLGRPRVITYAAGNYASSGGIDLARVQDSLVAAQAAVIGLWTMLLVMTLPMRPWGPLGRRSLSGLFGCSAVLVAYSTPLLGLFPADMMAAEAMRKLPPVVSGGLTPERVALAERGRYLFASASCAFCHGVDGSGGLKLSGPPGTIYTANITSDRMAGIGGWSDAAIARAIRSGVAKNGQPLYWQAMPWDHFSNFSEEDVRALVAYLRMLPPVAARVPDYRPPSPDDCVVYTAWTRPNTAPGCR
ncbi:c-type cytochrome [Rhodovulum sp. PH10]|uniref:c-type cytochrome n=1 Tax=Rhodovulum sp. PH10 TaxID=1187851 RepID=UPI00192C5BD2|nr:c-type cytochrome [Rhodovulum sp. PH10]